MSRAHVDPVDAWRVEPVRNPNGWELRYLARDEHQGATRLIRVPAGGRGSSPRPGQFEYHTCDEEIVLLAGSVDFDGWYRATPVSYMNHPPTWVHPSCQQYARDGDTVMLIKNSKPADFFYEPIPDGWDGAEFFARETGEPRGKGVTLLPLAGLDLSPVHVDGVATGEDAALLWHNPRTGWTTWLWRAPASWRGRSLPAAIGDELLVLSGDLALEDSGARLNLAWYYCLPDGAPPRNIVSHEGLLAVRWTRDDGRIRLGP